MNKEQVQERLEAIKERCEKATGGPWTSQEVYEPEEAIVGILYGDPPGGMTSGAVAFASGMNVGEAQAIEDARFIGHSRSDIPYLVSVIESLMEEVSDG